LQVFVKKEKSSTSFTISVLKRRVNTVERLTVSLLCLAHLNFQHGYFLPVFFCKRSKEIYHLPSLQKFQSQIRLDVLAKPEKSARMSTSIDLHPIQKERLIIPRVGSCYETQSQALVINTCGNE